MNTLLRPGSVATLLLMLWSGTSLACSPAGSVIPMKTDVIASGYVRYLALSTETRGEARHTIGTAVLDDVRMLKGRLAKGKEIRFPQESLMEEGCVFGAVLPQGSHIRAYLRRTPGMPEPFRLIYSQSFPGPDEYSPAGAFLPPKSVVPPAASCERYPDAGPAIIDRIRYTVLVEKPVLVESEKNCSELEYTEPAGTCAVYQTWRFEKISVLNGTDDEGPWGEELFLAISVSGRQEASPARGVTLHGSSRFRLYLQEARPWVQPYAHWYIKFACPVTEGQ